MFAAPPQRSLCPQYDSCVDDDDNDGDDISSSQWSMSPGPPSQRSITSLQWPLSLSHDYNSVNSVNGGCGDCDVTTSQSAMSSDLSSGKSVDITVPGPSTPTPSPYDSDDCVCDCGCAVVDQSSRKSDDLTGPTCPAPSLYDSNTNDDDDSDEDDNYDSDGFPLSRRASSRDDIATQGSICPAFTPYDSNAADDNTTGDAPSQWSMSPIYLQTLSSSSSSSRRMIQH